MDELLRIPSPSLGLPDEVEERKMKFSKEFKNQKVPEWTEAYVDYAGLKEILQQIASSPRSRQPSTPSRASRRGLSKGDIEDQVTDNGTCPRDDSTRLHKSKFFDGVGGLDGKFFEKLDEELSSVSTFYKDKVDEMKNEASSLNKQMHALTALRIKVAESDLDGTEAGTSDSSNVTLKPMRSVDRSSNGTSGMEYLDSITDDNGQDKSSLGGTEVNEGETSTCEKGCQDEINLDKNNKDSLKILERVKINTTEEAPLSAIRSVFKDPKEGKLCFNKEELKKAEEQLRVAFIEFYHKLCLLKNFSYMNLAAFSKIMEKYEKITSRRVSRSYMKIVDNSYLGSSDEVRELLERVEATFSRNFSNSKHRLDVKSLRPKEKHEKHSVTFLSGFLFGCSVALLVAVVLKIQPIKLADKPEGVSYIVNIFPLYSLFGYIVLQMLIYTLNTYFWRRYQVNYAFIFGFKRGTELGHRDIFLLSNGLAVLTLASFLTNLYLDFGAKSAQCMTVTELFPLVLICVVLGILLCPLDVIYRSSRFFFLRCIFRCISAPLYKVTLADFFLADYLTSQVQAIRSLDLYICYYGLGEYSRRQNKCHSHGFYNAFFFIIAVIPFWIRFLQCLRQWVEERDPSDGFNGLKYLLTIVAVLTRTAFELRKGRSWMVLALVSSAVATMMNTYWDIVVDWGLLQRKSKNPFLRDKLVLPHRSVYFAAMVLNVLLRLAWMQLVFEFKSQSLQKVCIFSIFSCLEIVRRGIWGFFRLENEHLSNVGKFRAFRSVPLPFDYDSDYDKEE